MDILDYIIVCGNTLNWLTDYKLNVSSFTVQIIQIQKYIIGLYKNGLAENANSLSYSKGGAYLNVEFTQIIAALLKHHSVVRWK